MTRCAECRREANPAVYKYIDMQRPLCRACAAGPLIRETTGTSFVRGAGEPVRGRDYACVVNKSY